MIQPIMKDVLFLGQKSDEATELDRQIITDLHDTRAAHKEHCVGMAANMIGSKKRIIIVSFGFIDVVVVNPVIIRRALPYETEEGCLSLQGTRKTRRFRKIRVQYQDEAFQRHTQDYEGQIAQIIQHECDHLDGIII